MPKDTGGSAFPNGYHHGMTLRDYFAGQALVGLFSNMMALGAIKSMSKESEDADALIARAVYGQADVMIAERNKGEQDDA